MSEEAPEICIGCKNLASNGLCMRTKSKELWKAIWECGSYSSEIHGKGKRYETKENSHNKNTVRIYTHRIGAIDR